MILALTWQQVVLAGILAFAIVSGLTIIAMVYLFKRF